MPYGIPLIAFIFAFSGFLIGGTIGFAAQKFIREKESIMYAICGGLLTGLLLFELIPEMFSTYTKVGVTLGAILGYVMMATVHVYFHSKKMHHTHLKALQSFIFLSLAISIHTFPTGIALGSSLNNHDTTNSLLLAIIFHHVPEGVALTATLFLTKINFTVFILTILFLSSVIGIGTITGENFQNVESQLQSIVMGSAVGGITFVVFNEMLYKAKKNMGMFHFLIFVVTGLLLMQLYIVRFL